MSPKTAARLIAAGRVAFGAAMLAAPGKVTKGWLGATAEEPSTQVAVRALGIRDLVIGAMTLHVVDHPQAGPRWVAVSGVADAVDLAATVAGRRALPTTGVVATTALAGGSAAAAFVLAGALRRDA